MRCLSVANEVTGIDMDVVAQRLTPGELARMVRANPPMRTLKTLVRKALGHDARFEARLASAQGVERFRTLPVLRMDAARMDFEAGPSTSSAPSPSSSTSRIQRGRFARPVGSSPRGGSRTSSPTCGRAIPVTTIRASSQESCRRRTGPPSPGTAANRAVRDLLQSPPPGGVARHVSRDDAGSPIRSRGAVRPGRRAAGIAIVRVICLVRRRGTAELLRRCDLAKTGDIDLGCARDRSVEVLSGVPFDQARRAMALLRDAGIPVNARRVVEGRWLYVAPADEEQRSGYSRLTGSPGRCSRW